jgi:hypothetical protein
MKGMDGVVTVVVGVSQFCATAGCLAKYQIEIDKIRSAELSHSHNTLSLSHAHHTLSDITPPITKPKQHEDC